MALAIENLVKLFHVAWSMWHVETRMGYGLVITNLAEFICYFIQDMTYL